MKRLIILGVAGMLSVPTLQAALSLGYSTPANGWSATLYDGPGNTGGGEFRAVTTWGTFNTFCLERFETFSYGTTYQVDINSAAVQGGNGGYAGGNQLGVLSGNAGAVGDPISVGTAWLYSNFVHGTLQDYDYADTSQSPGTRQQSANDLQIALWMLEGEVVKDGIDGLYNEQNDYWKLAQAAFGGNATGNAAIGQFGVYVMNLHNSPTGQDQLIAVPEPTTVIAGALLLVPFGVSTLRILRKKRTA